MRKFTKLFVSLSLGTAIYFGSVIGSSAATSYTVEEGDTLTAIAKQYNTTEQAIIDENKLSSNEIQVGQVLTITDRTSTVEASADNKSTATKKTTTTKKTTSTSYVTYKVKKGDTLYNIAKTYGTNTKTLKSLNKLKSDVIKIGQKLKVPKNAKTTKTTKKSSTGEKIIKEAKKYLGKPYVYGGSSPKGFDCAGYVYYVYNKAGKKIERSSSAHYYSKAKKVKTPQVGDLVFFSNTYKKGISHVGIYMGAGKMINASGTKVQIVSLNSSYWRNHFTGYGRI